MLATVTFHSSQDSRTGGWKHVISKMLCIPDKNSSPDIEVFDQKSGQAFWISINMKMLKAVYVYKKYDIALAMSSSYADPVLGHCPGWGYLNIFKYPHTGQCHWFKYLNTPSKGSRHTDYTFVTDTQITHLSQTHRFHICYRTEALKGHSLL